VSRVTAAGLEDMNSRTLGMTCSLVCLVWSVTELAAQQHKFPGSSVTGDWRIGGEPTVAVVLLGAVPKR
jgi:hypothetical protein